MLGAVAGGVVEDGGAAGALEDVSAGGGDGSGGVGGGGCSADLHTTCVWQCKITGIM